MCRKLTCLTSAFLVVGMTACVSAQLPAGWSSADIGSPAAAGSAQYEAATQTWTIQADGTGLRDKADQFHYAYKPVTGNCEMIVRVVSLEPAVDEWAMAGVMMRLSLDPSSPYLFMGMTPNGPNQDHAVTYYGREAPGGSADHESSGAMTFPYWVKLSRHGDVLAGYHSPDGKNWTEQYSVEQPLIPQNIYLGLAVTSNVAGTLVTAVLDAGPIKAHSPSPADGTQSVGMPLLKWTAGVTTVAHDMYFGTNPVPGPDEYIARLPLAQTSYFHGPGIAPGTTYYWRVDEVDADGTTIHTGDVWSFTSAPVTAYAPQPWDGAKWLDVETDLSWTPGAGAVSHDIYFGTDKTAVQAAEASTFVANQLPPRHDPGTLAEDTTYYWRIDEHDEGGAVHEGEVWSFATTGPGAGARAEYFKGTDLSGEPLLSRVEEAIDHAWGGGEIAAGLSDQISARWTANLEAPFTETYELITTSDDGVRLWLNGRRMIDNWTTHGSTDDVATVRLAAGQLYHLMMEWYDSGGSAAAVLSWQSPSIPRQPIPPGWLQLPVRAAHAYPVNAAIDVPQTPVLQWSAGENAAQHDVYFGNDADAVAGATPTSTGIYRGRQILDATSYDPGPLEPNATYYWRIDEVNTLNPDSLWKGNVWSFTTADFIVIDDFESYTNEVGRRVFEKWVDGLGFTSPLPGHPGNGSGATVGHDIWSTDSPYYDGLLVETADVHGGYQALPLYYDNTTPPYWSGAVRTWLTAQDWTRDGADTLVLYVRGKATNDAADLYVRIEDSAGHAAELTHPDAAAVKAVDWTEWKIPLSALTDAGVTASAVKKMDIGADSRTGATIKGTGVLFVDDIRVITAPSGE